MDRHVVWRYLLLRLQAGCSQHNATRSRTDACTLVRDHIGSDTVGAMVFSRCSIRKLEVRACAQAVPLGPPDDIMEKCPR